LMTALVSHCPCCKPVPGSGAVFTDFVPHAVNSKQIRAKKNKRFIPKRIRSAGIFDKN
jgi:hypothetical protein